jgi:glycosyltransferase involved in cell wall biosynthesis
MKPLRIAMIGQRGLPATYGGVERHVEEIGARLAEHGHEVVVFCRPGYSPESLLEYRGVTLEHNWTVPTMHLEAFLHSLTSSVATVGRGFDIVHFHALGPGLFTPIPRALTRAGVVQTIHGLDDRRAKWGPRTQQVLRAGGWLSAHVPHEVVVVSRSLQDHYQQAHDRPATYIPNGAPHVTPRPLATVRDELELQGRDYVLFVGRLVPEKDPVTLLRAFRDVETQLRLVIVGGTSFTEDYTAVVEQLAAADPRVILAGYRYSDQLAELLTNAALFVQPSQLEGLPITLLEAAAYGLPVIASDIEPHVEVVGVPAPGRELFPTGDVGALTAALQKTLDQLSLTEAGAATLQRDVLRNYDWDNAVDALEAVYARAAARAQGRSLQHSRGA